jgi:hypothetical protein
LAGSTIGKEENFDDLDKVLAEKPDVITETTSETADIVQESTSEIDASELETVNGKSSDSNGEP